MRRPLYALLALIVVGACSQAASSSDGSAISSADAGGDGGPCAQVPPPTLECTGLYSNFASKTVAPNIEPYAPASPLWSDGAEKERWIQLPPGQKIDAKNPNEWVFPIGTRLFKQFTYGGKRVETRLFQKTAPNYWVHATYKWNADDSATTISFGETIPFPNQPAPWVIPSPQDCDKCHRGRTDRILGFEAVNLGLAAATGVTLAQLVTRGLIEPAPSQVNLKIGDDGTGLGAVPLAWLHTNCGATCHNKNENSLAYGAGMVLRLDPAWLDGSPPSPAWDPVRTAIGALAVSGSVNGLPRIDPGNPAGSAIVQLIGQRGELQMPPAPLSRVVDTTDVAAITAWIQHMAVPDGGAPRGDAGTEGGSDAGSDASRDGAADAAHD
jgi:hypothetical protein